MGDAFSVVVFAIGIAVFVFLIGFILGVDDANLGHTFSKDDLIKAKVAHYDSATGELKLIKVEGKNDEQ